MMRQIFSWASFVTYYYRDDAWMAAPDTAQEC